MRRSLTTAWTINELCRIHQYLLIGLRVLVANYISVSHFCLHVQLGKIGHGGYLLNMLSLLQGNPRSTSRTTLLRRKLRRALLLRKQSWGVLSIFGCRLIDKWSLRKRVIHLNILLVLIPLYFWYSHGLELSNMAHVILSLRCHSLKNWFSSLLKFALRSIHVMVFRDARAYVTCAFWCQRGELICMMFIEIIILISIWILLGRIGIVVLGYLFDIPVNSVPIHILKLVVFLQEGTFLDVFQDQLCDSFQIECFISWMRINLVHIFLINNQKDLRIAISFQGVGLPDQASLIHVEFLIFGLVIWWLLDSVRFRH